LSNFFYGLTFGCQNLYADITAEKDGKTPRIATIDTYADGITPTKREATNAARIRAQTGEHLLLIPKPKKR
jgi:hypothetical protein